MRAVVVMSLIGLSALGSPWLISRAQASSLSLSTGNAEIDLNPLLNTDVLVIPSSPNANGAPRTGDVGQASWITEQDWITGWNIKDLRLHYDPRGDVLSVGVNFFGIAGDVDGNGDPGRADPRTIAAGGIDVPNLGFGEMLAVGFDLNNSGEFDVVAGVPNRSDLSDFQVTKFNSAFSSLPFGFGEPLPDHLGQAPQSPGPESPDVLFQIARFSELPGLELDEGFSVAAYAGTVYDIVAGEDQIPLTQIAPILPQQIPEPSTWLAWSCLAGVSGWLIRRRRPRAQTSPPTA